MGGLRYQTTITIRSVHRPGLTPSEITDASRKWLEELVGLAENAPSQFEIDARIDVHPELDVTPNYIELRSGGKVMVHWDSSDWGTTESVTAIVNAVKLFYEEGARAVRRIYVLAAQQRRNQKRAAKGLR